MDLYREKQRGHASSASFNLAVSLAFLYFSFAFCKVLLFLILTSSFFHASITWSFVFSLSSPSPVTDLSIFLIGSVLSYGWVTVVFNIHRIFKHSNIVTSGFLRHKHFITITYFAIPLISVVLGVYLLVAPLMRWLLFVSGIARDAYENEAIDNLVRLAGFLTVFVVLVLDVVVVGSKVKEARDQSRNVSEYVTMSDHSLQAALGTERGVVFLE